MLTEVRVLRAEARGSRRVGPHDGFAEDPSRAREGFPGLEPEKGRVSRPGAHENDRAAPLSHRRGARTERAPLGALPAEMAFVPYLLAD